jgi:hypothetical protein
MLRSLGAARQLNGSRLEGDFSELLRSALSCVNVGRNGGWREGLIQRCAQVVDVATVEYRGSTVFAILSPLAKP